MKTVEQEKGQRDLENFRLLKESVNLVHNGAKKIILLNKKKDAFQWLNFQFYIKLLKINKNVLILC